MYRLQIITAFVALATAFPTMMDLNPQQSEQLSKLAKRSLSDFAKRQNLQDPLGISRAETNCGPTPCLIFDPKEQLVSVTGEHAYASPGAGDIRGPCPGLNAAANHGYLPRSGIATIEETVSGLGAAYQLGAVVTAALAAYAVVLDGNIVEGVWSIGGPLPSDPITGGLLGTGQGLSYSHNNYEGDGSIARFDAYTNHGDAHSLDVGKFTAVYKTGGSDTSAEGFKQRYTLDLFRSHYEEVQDDAIATNPYYFTGAFSTIVVVPAAYNFVINLMSNHSASEPSGYLDGYNFKSFFGITGAPGSFVWNKGQERIPEHWYRRPSSNPYEGPQVVGDVALTYLAYPRTLKIGGNAGKTNSFVGLSVANLTGGVLNAQTLFEGDNFACFAFNLAQQAIPAFLKGPLAALNSATALLNKYISPLTSKLQCPQLGQYDQGLFNVYPGRKYSPTGPDTNYRP